MNIRLPMETNSSYKTELSPSTIVSKSPQTLIPLEIAPSPLS